MRQYRSQVFCCCEKAFNSILIHASQFHNPDHSFIRSFVGWLDYTTQFAKPSVCILCNVCIYHHTVWHFGQDFESVGKIFAWSEIPIWKFHELFICCWFRSIRLPLLSSVVLSMTVFVHTWKFFWFVVFLLTARKLNINQWHVHILLSKINLKAGKLFSVFVHLHVYGIVGKTLLAK